MTSVAQDLVINNFLNPNYPNELKKRGDEYELGCIGCDRGVIGGFGCIHYGCVFDYSGASEREGSRAAKCSDFSCDNAIKNRYGNEFHERYNKG
tara:strand:- start:400 stop:681 length:282 start_codon:yes stop_codon:yes gene_type:complete